MAAASVLRNSQCAMFTFWSRANWRIAEGVSLGVSKPMVSTLKLSGPSAARAVRTTLARCCVVVGQM